MSSRDVPPSGDLLGGRTVTIAFQPIVDMSNEDVFGYEVLVRDSGGSTGANGLVRQALARGEMNRLDRRVLTLCIRQRTVWAGLPLFVNIGPLSHPDFDVMARAYRRWVVAHGLDPARIVFEISERVPIVGGPGLACARALRAAGFGIALDDVGTGLSGLGALIEVRPDYIKVDGTITRATAQDPWAQQVVAGLVSLAANVGIRLIAEGIETGEHLRAVIRLGVRYVQGYYLGRPVVYAADPTPFTGRVGGLR